MPNNITDVNTFTSPIQTVADGDAASAANFALATQGLANRTTYLKNHGYQGSTFSKSNSTQTTTSASIVDIPTATTTIASCLPGDLIFVSGFVLGRVSAGTGQAYIRIVDNSSTSDDSQSGGTTQLTTNTGIPLVRYFTVVGTNTVTIKLGFTCSGGNTMTVDAWSFYAFLIRP